MYFSSAAFHLYRCRSSGAPASSRQRHAAGLRAWMAGAPCRLFLSWSGVSWPQGRQWWMSLIWPRSSSTCSSPCAPTTPAGDTSYAFFSFFCCRIFLIYFLLLWCHVCSLRDQDNAIIRPLPKIKRLISDNSCLSHIVQVVTLHLCISDWLNNQTWCFWCWWSIIIFFLRCLQLLLTFDPILVEKVANVLYWVMQDNPNLQRLYLSGVFFFIMMYTGSNVLPVAR